MRGRGRGMAAALAVSTGGAVGAQDTIDPPATAGADKSGCELHVWPSENYLGLNTGLLSGFGAVGAVADLAAHKNRVATTKDYMREYLGPDIQVSELEKAGLTAKLKLDGYRIVAEKPIPSADDAKKDPAVKAELKAWRVKLKGRGRLTGSTSPCYAELIGTLIFYNKAMLYGSNLFAGWSFRQFGSAQVATKVADGSVKNPLEVFPPKSDADVGTAKAELRDAFAKDFAEYVEKKVKP